MSRTQRSPAFSFLIVLGLLVLLGHVCALPVHAVDLATLAGHTHGAPDESSADESVHGASCEAVRSTFNASPAMFTGVPTTPACLVVHIAQRWPGRALPTFAVSLPLFLLHASLLI